jgi:hypothetical protein
MLLVISCLQSFQNLARFDEWHSFLQNVYLLLFLFPTFLLESFLSEILTRKTFGLLIKEWQNRILFIEGQKKVIKISGKASYAIAFLWPFVLCESHLFIYLFWIEKSDKNKILKKYFRGAEYKLDHVLTHILGK